jgi:hypothetical protein
LIIAAAVLVAALAGPAHADPTADLISYLFTHKTTVDPATIIKLECDGKGFSTPMPDPDAPIAFNREYFALAPKTRLNKAKEVVYDLNPLKDAATEALVLPNQFYSVGAVGTTAEKITMLADTRSSLAYTKSGTLIFGHQGPGTTSLMLAKWAQDPAEDVGKMANLSSTIILVGADIVNLYNPSCTVRLATMCDVLESTANALDAQESISKITGTYVTRADGAILAITESATALATFRRPVFKLTLPKLVKTVPHTVTGWIAQNSALMIDAAQACGTIEFTATGAKISQAPGLPDICAPLVSTVGAYAAPKVVPAILKTIAKSRLLRDQKAAALGCQEAP